MTHGVDANELFEVTCKVFLLNPARTKGLVLIYEDGYYGLPGGHLEHGEEVLDAARREINEELGIDYRGRLEEVGFWLGTWTEQGVSHAKIILGFTGELADDTEFYHSPDVPAHPTKIGWKTLSDVVDTQHYYNGIAYPDLIQRAIASSETQKEVVK